MKNVLVWLLLVCSAPCIADDYKVIEFTKSNHAKFNDRIYLVGTRSLGEPANFLVTRGQFNETELWDGEGKPGISIKEAITAAKWFYREYGNLSPIKVDLRRAVGEDMIIWHYTVELAKSPEKKIVPNEDILRVVILTSGEIVAPYYPGRK